MPPFDLEQRANERLTTLRAEARPPRGDAPLPALRRRLAAALRTVARRLDPVRAAPPRFG
jgi:hypothetical protein